MTDVKRRIESRSATHSYILTKMSIDIDRGNNNTYVKDATVQ
jgi:hypothetical protein